MRCFRTFHTAERTIEGVEASHMMRKGQVKRLDGGDSVGQAKFVANLFGVAAKVSTVSRPAMLKSSICKATS